MKKSFSLLLFVLLAVGAMAVPSFPGLVAFQQPRDREVTVSIYLKGDEKVHWAETEDGYSLLHADDGSLVYATLDEYGDMVPTDVLATDKERRTPEVEGMLALIPKHLHFSKRQVEELLGIWSQVESAKTGPKTMTNVVGEKNFLVILFAFKDKGFHFGKNAFRFLFNQVNYTANGSTGSVRDYYHDVSGGLLTLRADIAGPYTGKRNMAEYGNASNGYQLFAHEAVDSAAKDVDFSKYDNDGDGYIDGLHIIFAGYGEEAGGGADAIWSHKWNIFDPPTYNGTVVDVYSCSPELSGNFDYNLTAIGVVCHELGHVFGSPDYYDTDYEGSGGQYPGLGMWDIMSSGSWNCSGHTPAHHNPYTKIYIYKWADCDTIDATSAVHSVEAVDLTNNSFLRVNTSTPGDFFLLENRQAIKWDRGVGRHGLLVYHVHPSASGAHVSNYSHPQQIYVIAPGYTNDSCPTSTPASYGTLEKAPLPRQLPYCDSLTDNSLPWNRPWSGVKNNMPLTNISVNSANNRAYFTVNKSAEVFDAAAVGIANDKIMVSWGRYGSFKTLVLMNKDNAVFGTPCRGYTAGDTVDGGGTVLYIGEGETAVADSLARNATCYFKVFTCKEGNVYSEGIVLSASTLDCDSYDWEEEDFETVDEGALPECWQGQWGVTQWGGNRAAMSDSTEGARDWRRLNTKPIAYDTVYDAVLCYRLHMDGGCGEQTLFATEYRAGAGDGWTMVDSCRWMFGMPEWKEVYLPLRNVGDNSGIRFSVFSDGSDRAAVDDVRVVPGVLVVSSSDANGSIVPNGYNIISSTDTVVYSIVPLEGYRFKSLLKDGVAVAATSLRQNDDGSYGYAVCGADGSVTLKALFERKNAIDEPTESVVRVYPNPTDGMVTVLSDGCEVIEVYDVVGRKVVSLKPATTETQVDLGKLGRGVYTLRVGTFTTRVVRK